MEPAPERRVVRLGGAFRIGVIGPTMVRRRPPLVTPGWGLVWVVAGRGELRGLPEGPVRLRPGIVFQRLPGRPMGHSYRDDPPPATCFLALPAGIHAALQACAPPALRRPWFALRSQTGLLARWTALADRLAAAPEGAEAPVLAEAVALAVELLGRARTPPRADADGRWLAQACAALTAHAGDRLDTAAVLAPLGGSYAWARRRFTSLTRQSPAAFRIARRLEAARALLLSGGLSIAAIAERLGYATPFAFTRQFTRACGQSPSRFRSTHGE